MDQSATPSRANRPRPRQSGTKAYNGRPSAAGDRSQGRASRKEVMPTDVLTEIIRLVGAIVNLAAGITRLISNRRAGHDQKEGGR